MVVEITYPHLPGEIRCCEMGGGAKPFLDLLCQRGWTGTLGLLKPRHADYI